MSAVSKSLQIGNYAFTAIAVICLLITVYAWLEALFLWGGSYAYAEAIVWTAVTIIASVPSLVIDYIQTRRD